MATLLVAAVVGGTTVGMPVAPASADSPPGPQALLVKAPDGAPVVARYDAADFGVDPTGSHDSRAALQAAVDAAASTGGGVVWLGAGRYLLTGGIQIPKSVSLLGAWRDPDDATDLEERDDLTVLIAQPDPASSTPLVTVGGSAGVEGVTVFYPEQHADDPIAYAPTVKLADRGEDFTTLRHVTLVNPYEAVRVGPEGNELHWMNEVYASPLKKGITIDFATDVGRIEGVHLSPEYWERWDGTSAESIAAFTRENLTGLEIGRSDGQYLTDLDVTDAAIGIRMRKDVAVAGDPVTSANGQFTYVSLDRVNRGLVLEELNTQGVQLTKASIHANVGENPVAIEIAPSLNDTVLQCHECEIAAPDGTGVLLSEGTDGAVSLHGGSIAAGTSRAAVVDGGALSVTATTVGRTADRSAPILVTAGAGAVTVAGLAEDDVQLVDRDRSQISVVAKAPKQDAAPERPEHEVPAGPKGKTVVDVTAAPYRAAADGSADATAAVQRALDDVAADKGGIVFLPPGTYRMDGTLDVPRGVELRGAQVTSFHSNGAATRLLTTQGAGKAKGTPFITLQRGAGVTGLLIWYPEQKADAVTEYPFAIKLAGRDAWVRYVNFGNAYQGVDAETANTTGHQIDWLIGAPLKTGLAVGGGSSHGTVRHAHYNPHLWFRTIGSGLPGAPADYDSMIKLFFQIMGFQDRNLTTFRFGDAKNEVVDMSFGYRGHYGVHLAPQDGRGFSGLLWGLWVDGLIVSYQVDGTSGKGVDCVNCSGNAVPDGWDPTTDTTTPPPPESLSEAYIRVSSAAGDKTRVRFSNWVAGAFNFTPNYGVIVQAGRVDFSQAYFLANAKDDRGTLLLQGGETTAVNVVFGRIGKINANRDGMERQAPLTEVVAGAEARGRISVVLGRDGFTAVLPSGKKAVTVDGAVWRPSPAAAPVPFEPTDTIPTAYIELLYTEVLGRPADPGGIAFHEAFFQNDGCSVATLRQRSYGFFESGEFTARGLTDAEKAGVLYRSILQREPSDQERAAVADRLASGLAITVISDELYATTEFLGLARSLCEVD
ncbi:glycoside hydrolase family 55 protein [Microbacterium sp. SSW1-49]|uniref:Glycoside hydrolase family 55 protein n=1 Tax=Microbacterium croceum TaxID=2851645 RepID=A0ABT0FA42_9MICO|nr:glycoside hydrolase family 55 protein [Microbacterium croceum]MCK2034932.1 glycoside hydrolase family 55 protein [Microbacterium croceum]